MPTREDQEAYWLTHAPDTRQGALTDPQAIEWWIAHAPTEVGGPITDMARKAWWADHAPEGALASPLLDGLLGFWKMDEASDTRVDAQDGFDLALLGNAIGSEPGHLGDAAKFELTSGMLRCATGPAEGAAIDFTIAWWSKGQISLNNLDNDIYEDGWEIFATLTQTGFYGYSSTGSPSGQIVVPYDNTAWIFWVATYDAASEAMQFFKNNVLVGSESQPIGNELACLNISGYFGTDADTMTPNGTAFSMQHLGIWNRVLPDWQQGLLWNDGDGTTHPF